MTEPTQAGIHYHTDAAGRRWRIRVRWDRVNRQRLLAERQALLELRDATEPTDMELREYARGQHEFYTTDRQNLRDRLAAIAEELGP